MAKRQRGLIPARSPLPSLPTRPIVAWGEGMPSVEVLADSW